MKIRLPSFLTSSKGFILIHVLVFYMFFTSVILVIVMQKQMLIQQVYFHELASFRIETEKEIIRKIRNEEINDDFELMLFDQRIIFNVKDVIEVRVCSATCYVMLVDYDRHSDVIISITYE
jgi:hypothetical protein